MKVALSSQTVKDGTERTERNSFEVKGCSTAKLVLPRQRGESKFGLLI